MISDVWLMITGSSLKLLQQSLRIGYGMKNLGRLNAQFDSFFLCKASMIILTSSGL